MAKTYPSLFILGIAFAQLAYTRGDEPLITNHLTQDFVMICDLKGFFAETRSPTTKVHSLQIVHRNLHGNTECDQNTDTILATLDTVSSLSETFSSHLTECNRVYHMDANYDSSNVADTFLRLLYVGVDMFKYGPYYCKVTYEDHPSDYQRKYWCSETTNFIPSRQNVIEKQSISVEKTEGLALTCSFTPDEVSSDAYVQINHSNVNSDHFRDEKLAEWRIIAGTLNKTYCAPIARLCEGVHISSGDHGPATVVVRVHLKGVRCDNEGNYSCIVTSPSRSNPRQDITEFRDPLRCLTTDKPCSQQPRGYAALDKVASHTMCITIALLIFFVFQAL